MNTTITEPTVANLNILCPICGGRWYDLEDSLVVCERHLDWLVTTCEHCGRYCFSSAAGMCPKCFDLGESEFDRAFAMEEA
jgi:hypothetical protein